MHQIISPTKLALCAPALVVQKRTLEDEDLQIVADLVRDGLREGLYADIVNGKKRSEVLRFLRHLLTKCEIRHHDRFGKCVSKRAAALCVYTVKGEVVGFSVLGQIFSRSIQNDFDVIDEFNDQIGTDADHVPIVPSRCFSYGTRRDDKSRISNLASDEEDKTLINNGVELLMLGVRPLQRGLGYGAAILDSFINGISHRHFNLFVRCPTDTPLLFAMLVTRGFIVVGRSRQRRILRFLPPSGNDPTCSNSKLSRYCE
jgi:hypothetical protein